MPDRPAPRPRFAERLTVPWWWWPLGAAVAALLAAEVHLGYPGVRAWLPYLLTGPLALGALAWLGRHRVRVEEGELHVGSAHIALRHLGQVSIIAPKDKRRALGPELDPAAFVLHRPWIGPAVRVELTDPADPTPYWLFSVRDAGGLAAQLRPAAPPAVEPPGASRPDAKDGRPPEGGRPS